MSYSMGGRDSSTTSVMRAVFLSRTCFGGIIALYYIYVYMCMGAVRWRCTVECIRTCTGDVISICMGSDRAFPPQTCLVPIDLLCYFHRPATQGQLQGWLLLRARSGGGIGGGDAEGVEDVGPEDVHAGVVLRLLVGGWGRWLGKGGLCCVR